MPKAIRNLSVTVVCHTCKKSFHPKKGRETTNKYCSRSCMGESGRKANFYTVKRARRVKIFVPERPCEVCGSIYTPEVSKRNTSRFCSHACRYIGHKKKPIAHEEIIRRLEEKTDRSGDCWLWKGATVRGYGSLNIRGRGVCIASRLSYEVHIGPIPDGLFICHKCDTPACINPDHLFAGTPKDNIQDMVNKGRYRKDRNLPRGERHHATKLTIDQVLAIHASTEDTVILAKLYGVSRETINNIKRGSTWKFLWSTASSSTRCEKEPV